jgi:hypothetical protein
MEDVARPRLERCIRALVRVNTDEITVLTLRD